MYQTIDQIQPVKGYQLKLTEQLSDISSIGALFVHEKTGARVAVISNEDSNKVFSIGFRTPPKDSTGVAHIVEHTVLCGSKRFPSKDPFVELVKGSLNTFLNAMTYPDKTVYPVASPNDADFQNLMEVYLDAVFYPNIYKREEIFKQEGWHYHLEEVQGPLTYNGVVYNEMKGVYSSPDSQVERTIQQSLFPDSIYGNESGGAPEDIPDLSWEEYLDFHRTYYHPSNSYIYLYGDMDVEEKLRYIDEAYLSDFDRLVVDSEIHLQPEFSKPVRLETEYAVTEEDEAPKSYLSYNTVIGTSLDREAYIAYQLLEYVLFSSAAGPVKQRLIKEGIGDEVSASFDNGILQPVFSVLIKGANSDDEQRFVDILREELTMVVENGIEKDALLGAINNFEFKYKEADFGTYPKGLIYGLSLFDSWLYDDAQPFTLVKQNEIFEKMRSYVGSDYFEQLIVKGILENKHTSQVVMNPKKGLAKQREQELAKKLSEKLNSLSEEEKKELVEATKGLIAYQTEPSSPEDLAKIPVLKRSDIKKEISPVHNQEYQLTLESDPEKKITLLHHDYKTNGIGYLKLYFDLTDYEGYAAYYSLLALAMGYMDCENQDFAQLTSQIDLYSGGITNDVDYFIKNRDANQFSFHLVTRGKFLYVNAKKVMALMEEMTNHTKLFDLDRLAEIVSEAKSRAQARMLSNANSVAAGRASSYFVKSALLSDEMNGVGYYRFLTELEKGGKEKLRETAVIMSRLLYTMVKRGKLIISLTADKAGADHIREMLPDMLERLLDAEGVKAFYSKEAGEEILALEKKGLGSCEVKQEGLKTSGQVQFVARAGNYHEAGLTFRGELRILKTILGYEYLWNQVRVKGGAYGCSCMFYRDGLVTFSSYRDPKLRETLEVFEKAAEYLESFQADEKAMTKYIIGTISSMDVPLTPSMEGTRSFSIFMSNGSLEKLQKERDEILAADDQAIRELAPYVRTVMEQGYLCVVGNEDRIEQEKDCFQVRENYV